MANALACWQGLNNVGSFTPYLSLQTSAEICYGNHMASVCIYFSIFANAFCPDLYFYRMNSCMQIGVLMRVFMCFYDICLGLDSGIHCKCVHTENLTWLCWWVGVAC